MRVTDLPEFGVTKFKFRGPGFLRQEYLLAFSCKTRYFCPSCQAKRVAALGAEGYWRWWLDYTRKRAQREHVEPTRFAIIYAHLGEKDEAFEWLEKAFEQNEAVSNLKVDPRWNPLRDDPRFTDLLRRMNLEEP